MSDESWRQMDRATRSAAYDNSAAVPDGVQRVARWREQSAAFRAEHRAELDLPYGPGQRNKVDIFPAERADAPLFVFIHGGYWQRNAKEGFSCIAAGPLAHGISVALVGYTLTPEATLTTIAEEIRAAIAFLRERDTQNGIGRKLIVSGWSAGGHLAALASRFPGVDATLAISGIFDLEPLRGTTIDDMVHITAAEAEELSPQRLEMARKPFVVAYGADELPELCRQSRDFHQRRLAQGLQSTLLPVGSTEHFSVMEELISPSGELTKAIIESAR